MDKAFSDTESSNLITLYHGSEFVINPPVFGKGEPSNDYGRGFYVTEYPELAAEWACPFPDIDGVVNKYELNLTGLSMLDLDKEPIEHWISILVQNRDNQMSRLAQTRMNKFVTKYPFSVAGYDVVKGWRADDSYYTFIRDFFRLDSSLETLVKAMRLGEYGIQYCLISEKAFGHIRYIDHYIVDSSKYNPLKIKRDDDAKTAYESMDSKGTGTVIWDIVGRD